MNVTSGLPTSVSLAIFVTSCGHDVALRGLQGLIVTGSLSKPLVAVLRTVLGPLSRECVLTERNVGTR